MIACFTFVKYFWCYVKLVFHKPIDLIEWLITWFFFPLWASIHLLVTQQAIHAKKAEGSVSIWGSCHSVCVATSCVSRAWRIVGQLRAQCCSEPHIMHSGTSLRRMCCGTLHWSQQARNLYFPRTTSPMVEWWPLKTVSAMPERWDFSIEPFATVFTSKIPEGLICPEGLKCPALLRFWTRRRRLFPITSFDTWRFNFTGSCWDIHDWMLNCNSRCPWWRIFSGQFPSRRFHMKLVAHNHPMTVCKPNFRRRRGRMCRVLICLMVRFLVHISFPGGALWLQVQSWFHVWHHEWKKADDT